MSRRKGFSLVELLIVLAVIAALIATITTVALNAIRKAQATKVAQNIKTLASAIENAAYVNGTDNGKIKQADGVSFFESQDHIALLARDVDKGLYGIWYTHTGNGVFSVSVFTKESVDFTTSKGVLGDLTETTPGGYLGASGILKLGNQTGTGADFSFGYNFSFTVY